MAKAAKQVSEIDRLIELASDAKSPATKAPVHLIDAEGERPSRALSLEDRKDPRPSMWRALLQLRVLLPYVAKVLPLVERGLLGTNISGQAFSGHAMPGQHGAQADTSRFDRGIAEVEGAHRDLTAVVKTQTGEIKFLQEQVTWLSESLEKNAFAQQELIAGMASLKKSITIAAVILAVLLGALFGLVAVAAFGNGFHAG
jgi:hypothetical protein